MTKARKIFISHHHSDAKALVLLKETLEKLDFQCFLARVDIEHGENDLERIKEEAKSCDALVYISGEKANKSPICQQEVGIAVGLGKKILTAVPEENPPKGFITHNNGIIFEKIDDDFCEKVYWALSKALPFSEEIKKHLDILGVKGFSQLGNDDVVYLEADNWNDFRYETKFHLYLNDECIGFAKIGRIGQRSELSTHEILPNFFTHLQLPFFSYVPIESDENIGFKPEQAESLRHLLNETALMSDTDKKIVVCENVYQISLMRDRNE